MDEKIKNNIIYSLKFIIPIIIVIGLFLGGVNAGIITFEKKIDSNTGTISATITLEFEDGLTYSKDLTLDNSTVYDFLLSLEENGDIKVESTYWESFDSYVVDSITYNGEKYEGDISYYWAVYINEMPAMEGADKIYVQNDDLIEWKYESF